MKCRGPVGKHASNRPNPSPRPRVRARKKNSSRARDIENARELPAATSGQAIRKLVGQAPAFFWQRFAVAWPTRKRVQKTTPGRAGSRKPGLAVASVEEQLGRAAFLLAAPDRAPQLVIERAAIADRAACSRFAAFLVATRSLAIAITEARNCTEPIRLVNWSPAAAEAC